MRNKPHKWTHEEIKFLKKNFGMMNCTLLAKHLNRSVHAIRGAMIKLNLIRTPQERLRLMEPTFRKKGYTPPNKGRRGFKITRRKNRSWRLPVPIGTIRVQHQYRDDKTFSYKRIKITQNKWVDLHRYNWENTFGKIPKIFVVQFRDGNSLNCEPSNLYLISRNTFRLFYINIDKISQTHRDLYNSGKLFASDRWIAARISKDDNRIRVMALQNPQMLELKRMQLMLRKEIHQRQEH